MGNIYLNEDNVDDLGRMLVALLSEFWILRDRMAILESLLEKAKVLTAEDIESFSYTPAQEEEMEKLRDRIVAAVIGAPVAAKERSVDQILERAGFKRPEKALETA